MKPPVVRFRHLHFSDAKRGANVKIRRTTGLSIGLVDFWNLAFERAPDANRDSNAKLNPLMVRFRQLYPSDAKRGANVKIRKTTGLSIGLVDFWNLAFGSSHEAAWNSHIRLNPRVCRSVAGIFGASYLMAGVVLAAEPTVQTSQPVKVINQTGAPIAMIRTLQLLQDQIAAGSTQAFSAQRGLIASIEARMLQMDSQTWQNPDNVDAAILFSLSGGPPSVLRHMMVVDSMDEQRRTLLLGSLAYLEGRKAEAVKRLDSVGELRAGRGLHAQIDFMKASLIVGDEPQKAMDLLDKVRLNVPGTLVEEAALRRQLLVSRERNDFGRFVNIAGDYIRRFEKSAYAGNFRHRLGSALIHFDFSDRPNDFQKLEHLLSGLTIDAQREVYLDASRKLIEAGKLKQATPVSLKAKTLCEGSEPCMARSMLYMGAINVVSADTLNQGLSTLESVKRSQLSDGDVKLLDHAVYVGRSIINSAKSKAEREVALSNRPTSSPSGENATLKKAQDAVSGIDKLLMR